MPVLDYFAIEEGIETILKADAGLTAISTNVFVEDESLFDLGKTPAIFIYLDRRDAPLDMQRIAAGTRTDYQMRFALWCLGFHMDSIRQASNARDDLIGLAEVALMKNRTLGGTVTKSWLEGGRFLSGEVEGGFMASGEIILVADGPATTA